MSTALRPRRYQKHGYVTCFIHDIQGLKTGNVTVEVTEGKVNSTKVVFMDAQGQPTGRPGNSDENWILDHVHINVSALAQICASACMQRLGSALCEHPTLLMSNWPSCLYVFPGFLWHVNALRR